MERKIVGLPQSDYKYFILDPSQPIQLECREGTQKGIITLRQIDLLNILEWAYPDAIYKNDALPEKSSDIFPAYVLNTLRCKLDGKGYEWYEVRYNAEANEYVLLGLKERQWYHLALWRLSLPVRSLREVVDDAAPYMHTFIDRHAASARLCFYLVGAAVASFIAYDRLLASQSHPSLMLYYVSWFFCCLSGITVGWYILSYKKYQRASTIRMVENIEDDIVGTVFM